MNSKKGNITPGGIFTVVVLVLLLAWLIIYTQRECHSDANCTDGFYCGSDFKCHEFPQQNSGSGLVAPSLILGISIIIAAFILRWQKRKPRPKKKKAPTPSSLDAYEDESTIKQK